MPNYYSSEVESISWYNPATGTTVQADYIDPGNLSISREPIRQGVQQGKQVTVKYEYTATITVFDHDLISQLRSWEQTYTPVRMASAGRPVVLWERDSYINITRSIEQQDGLQGYDVEITTRIPATEEFIWDGTNLLAGENKLNGQTVWGNPTSGVPEGYTSEFDTDAFSSGAYTGTTAASGSERLYKQIVFPVSGVNLHLSTNITTLHGSADDNVRIRQRNYGDSLLPSVEAEETAGVTGRLSANASTHTDVYTLELDVIRCANISASDSVVIEDPMLRVQDVETYTES